MSCKKKDLRGRQLSLAWAVIVSGSHPNDRIIEFCGNGFGFGLRGGQCRAISPPLAGSCGRIAYDERSIRPPNELRFAQIIAVR